MFYHLFQSEYTSYGKTRKQVNIALIKKSSKIVFSKRVWFCGRNFRKERVTPDQVLKMLNTGYSISPQNKKVNFNLNLADFWPPLLC